MPKRGERKYELKAPNPYQHVVQRHDRPWTEEEDDILKANYKDLSTGQIAKLLSGRTRNSVISRAGRLGLATPRAVTAHPMSAQVKDRRKLTVTDGALASSMFTRMAERKLVKKPSRTKTNSVVSAPVDIAAEKAIAGVKRIEGEAFKAVPEAKHVTLLELTDAQCRWPVAGPHGEQLFCGAQRTTLRYCATHQRTSTR